MKTFSFEKIIKVIIDILSVNSLDAYYCKKHPYFSKTKLLNDKLFEEVYSKFDIGYSADVFSDNEIERRFCKCRSFESNKSKQERAKALELMLEAFQQLKERFFKTPEEMLEEVMKIEGIIKKDIPSKPDNKEWENRSFRFWILNNLNKIESFEADKLKKQNQLEQENKSSMVELKKLERNNKNLQNKQQGIKEKIQQIKNDINNYSARKVDYDKKIDENNNEIATIKNTDSLKDKAPYINRIKDLQEENDKLLVSCQY